MVRAQRAKRISRFKIVSLFIVVGCLIGAQFVGVSPTLAATIDKISVTCTWVSLRGKTEVRAPYVRVQAVLGSDLTNVLATQVVPTQKYVGASYRALLDISGAHLPDGTLVVVAAGEWDGTHYLRPATITSRNCAGTGATPTFVASPTFPPTPFPTFTRTPIQPPATPTPLPTYTPVYPTPLPSTTPTFVASPTFPPTPFPTFTRTPFMPTPFPTRTPFVPSVTPSPVNPPSTPTPTPFLPTPFPTYTPVNPPATPTPPPY